MPDQRSPRISPAGSHDGSRTFEPGRWPRPWCRIRHEGEMNTRNARIWTGNARMHLFAQDVHFRFETTLSIKEAEPAGLDEAIRENQVELCHDP